MANQIPVHHGETGMIDGQHVVAVDCGCLNPHCFYRTVYPVPFGFIIQSRKIAEWPPPKGFFDKLETLGLVEMHQEATILATAQRASEVSGRTVTPEEARLHFATRQGVKMLRSAAARNQDHIDGLSQLQEFLADQGVEWTEEDQEALDAVVVLSDRIAKRLKAKATELEKRDPLYDLYRRKAKEDQRIDAQQKAQQVAQELRSGLMGSPGFFWGKHVVEAA